MEKKTIDELFKNGLTKNELSYQEADWVAMEQKLAAHKVKKLQKIWLLSLGTAAAILLGIFLTVWRPETEGEQLKPINSWKRPADAPSRQPQIDLESMKKDVEKNVITQQARVVPDQRETQTIRIDKDGLLAQVKTVTPSTDSKETYLVLPHAPVNIKQTHLSSNVSAVLPSERKDKHGYLSIMAAPDLTGIRGAGSNELSPNIGVLYTLPLNNRWSISGGLAYAKKNYNAPYRFYRPKTQGNWTVPPTNVEAVCDVLDIPIELNYQVYRRGATQLKLSAGASSYFMLREQYQFFYDENNGTGYNNNLPSSYKLRGQNNHLFGIANIAISLEHNVSDNMSLAIRPFVKLPLTGVGYGQAKLESKGLAVFFNFKLGEKNK
ncbi:outer membrane beta-barrel protein [Olivibacter sp. SDN3]|uniref:outer membrane beta-barrel protein n=1 Tax=Olivibacter sp. SDN3 TaxID=2764720 RepID=UPI0016513E8C|nr:outer membrane beta-barrel protein [Olivibacter sp. SDN3]QNL49874.1 outer membrane beta-barrel protein [Olivibacter sp. SDN3]